MCVCSCECVYVCVAGGSREMLNYSRRRILPGAIVRERGGRGLIFTVRRLQEASGGRKERNDVENRNNRSSVRAEIKDKCVFWCF